MIQTSERIGILDNLVTQFSSALDCFRELVQNALDAGSSVVDVWTEYVVDETEEAGPEGAIVLHVDDWGEGMDRTVIDEQFTRLFSSTKRRDLTKIGKFGIGFVSVFALDPKAVIVRTGRNGQYWEVFFREDRSFQVTALDYAVEGTQISIVLPGDIYRYSELVTGIRKTLKRWCYHAEAEIGFEDRSPIDGRFPERELINEPFEVAGICPVQVEHQGTTMALAYAFEPTHSFFNRGLTLASGPRATESLDERRERFAHISFKISSRYFEHTLTRETIIADEHFERGMKLLEQAAAGELLDALLDTLEELVSRPQWKLSDTEAYTRYLAFLMQEPPALFKKIGKRPILRLIDGAALTPSQMYEAWRRDGRILLSESPSPLLTEVLAQGVPVLWGKVASYDDDRAVKKDDETSDATQSVLKLFLRAYLDYRARHSLLGYVLRFFDMYEGPSEKRPIAAPEDVYLPVRLDEEIPDALAPIVEATATALKTRNASYKQLTTCRLSSFEREIPLFVVARKLGPLMARPPAGVVETHKSRRLSAAINRDHPHFQTLCELYERSPELAARMLARSLTCTSVPGKELATL